MSRNRKRRWGSQTNRIRNSSKRRRLVVQLLEFRRLLAADLILDASTDGANQTAATAAEVTSFGPSAVFDFDMGWVLLNRPE